MWTLTLSVYSDHIFFLNASYSPFFLIVCSRLSIVERWVELRGRSDVLNLLRGRKTSSSLDRTVGTISIAAIPGPECTIVDSECAREGSIAFSTSGGCCRLLLHYMHLTVHEPPSGTNTVHSCTIHCNRIRTACTLQSPLPDPHFPLFHPQTTMVHKILFWSGFGSSPPNLPRYQSPD